MAIRNDSLFGAEVPRTQALRAFPSHDGIRPGTLAIQGSAATLPSLTPLYYDTAAATWKIWVGDTNEVNTITANATAATAGTFTLTVNGVVSAAIAFDATAAAVQAALEAMAGIGVGQVTAVATTGANLGVNSAVVTLTWGGTLAGQDITITIQTGGLTGNVHALATTTAGGTNPAGVTGEIDGFIWAPDDAHVPSTTEETTIQVFRAGSIHAADIPPPTGTSRTDLNEALRESSLREKNIEITGLSGVY